MSTTRLTLAGRVTLFSLFFAWGIVAVLVRMTVPHFRETFDLGYRDALLIQSAFFITYLLFARISGSVVARIGLRSAVVLGITLMAVGSLWLAVATLLQTFAALLPAVFVMATGITFLQVAANPLAAIEGGLKTTQGNLTFAQGFNSLGTVAAPLLAAAAFLGTAAEPLTPVRWLFGAICLALILLAFLARSLLAHGPQHVPVDSPPASVSRLAPFERNRLIAGVAALFLYVGAEVSISTTLVNLLEADGMIAATRTSSALLTSVFWLGMLVGRFASVPLLDRLDRRVVLGFSGVACAILCIVAAFAGGTIAAVAILASGLFAGLQFPTIFAIASADLEPASRARAAGWLCTGIVGGGIVPLVYGGVADRVSIEMALVVPFACFLVIALFAWRFGKEQVSNLPASQAG
ncbi:MFS transporter [Aurantiacibacter sp. MUD61]|uniref:MFS transporter n=1 Tax=Aurantiacibacter sp. MUD61 TaxID=3009083 RepID=UPI0022F0B2C6|nr:MFS transporter [Aurantiacibacter sp. MUD61]